MLAWELVIYILCSLILSIMYFFGSNNDDD